MARRYVVYDSGARSGLELAAGAAKITLVPTVRSPANGWIITAMGDLLKLIWHAVAGLFRSRAALQTEVLALRHHLNVPRRRAPKRIASDMGPVG
jgi:hypothetical protein